jgi:hypothetical protein
LADALATAPDRMEIFLRARFPVGRWQCAGEPGKPLNVFLLKLVRAEHLAKLDFLLKSASFDQFSRSSVVCGTILLAQVGVLVRADDEIAWVPRTTSRL